MNSKLIMSAVFASVAFLLNACATVGTAPFHAAQQAKEFNPPSENKAGIYIFRTGILGGALKKDVWVNKECLGETAPNVFFYTEVTPGNTEIATESEFSPNVLMLHTESNQHYFVRQYIKPGVFVGSADLEQVHPNVGKATVLGLPMAVPGYCSKATP